MLLFANPTAFLIVVIVFVIAIVLHEWAHAYVATLLGDPGPRIDGRLTLNPMAHLDLFGSLMLLFVGFGWGRPVGVNPKFFSQPKLGFALVAIAGPLMNIVLALLALFLLVLIPASPLGTILVKFFDIFIQINILLAVFNLLPLPPLDGGQIVTQFVPKKVASWLWEYGFIILFVAIGVQMFLHIQTITLWIQWGSALVFDALQLVVLFVLGVGH